MLGVGVTTWFQCHTVLVAAVNVYKEILNGLHMYSYLMV